MKMLTNLSNHFFPPKRERKKRTLESKSMSACIKKRIFGNLEGFRKSKSF